MITSAINLLSIYVDKGLACEGAREANLFSLVQLSSTCLRVVQLNEPMGKGIPFTAGSGVQSRYASQTLRRGHTRSPGGRQQLRTRSARGSAGRCGGPRGGRPLLRRRPRKRSAEPRSARVLRARKYPGARGSAGAEFRAPDRSGGGGG